MPEQYDTLAAVAAFIESQPWAVAPGTFRLHAAQLQSVPVSAARVDAQGRAGVAVIPVRGVLTQRPIGGLFGMLFGGASYEQIGNMALEADNNPDVSRIVYDFDSPGGSVWGIEPLTQLLGTIQKPQIGIANSVAMSAGYWLLSQMGEAVVSPSGSVGSIGVLFARLDTSKAEEAMGVEEIIVGEPEGKVEEFQQTPTDAVIARLKSEASELYGRFVAAVAKGRGVSPDTVRKSYGQGRPVLDTAAKAAGLIDRVEGMRDLLARASNPRGRIGKRPRAEAAAARLDAWS